MDDIPANSQTTSSSLTKIDVKQTRSLPTWAAFGLSLLALVLSSITIIRNQSLYKQIQQYTTAPVTNLNISANKTLETLQSRMQQIEQMQQQVNSQILQSQQHIQHLINTPSRPTQDWDIEIAQRYLDLAQISMNWARNNIATLHLLQSAEQILINNNQANIQPIRQAISLDIATLMQIPSVDTQNILEKLSNIKQKTQKISAQIAPPRQSSTEPTTETANGWRKNWKNSLQQLHGLISIRYQDESILTPFNPENISLLRQNIAMNIQEAIFGLLEQNQSLYMQALQAAVHNITFGFNQAEPKTQAIIQELQALQTVSITYPTPKLHPYVQLFATYFNQTPSKALQASRPQDNP